MSKQPNMLATSIREVIAPVLLKCPSECGIVSITEVKVTNDCGIATVYISALFDTEVAVAYLQKGTKALHKRLSVLGRQRIPQLRFKVDEALVRGNKIEKLLEN